MFDSRATTSEIRTGGPDFEAKAIMMSETGFLKPKNPSSYELRERLGEGLSSRVVAAIRRDADGFSEQNVVLKILKSETAVSWLQKEFAALHAVNSRYCVRVLAWETFNQGPALVLERIDGVTLHELGRRFPLTDVEIDEIAYQIERGLSDLHAASIFHGDLSPKNILVTRNGDVKLIDFGASSQDSNELVATPAYAAHSRWQGSRVSRESDFASWALIAADLRSCFACVPPDHDRARLRAAEFADVSDSPVRVESIEADRRSIGRKVEILQSERLSANGSTAVLGPVLNDATLGVPGAATLPSRTSWRQAGALAVVLLLVISTPVFSTPETARTLMGALRISTMKWVEVSVDSGVKRFAPFQTKIGAGRHRLQWRSQRGSGEFEVVVAADQVQTLHDSNFKR